MICMETIHYLWQDLFEWHQFFCIGHRPNIFFLNETVFFYRKNSLNASQNRVNASADHATTKKLKKTVPIGFIVPHASSCAFENAISYFCLLALFLCLTNMILQFLYLTFQFIVLLCLTLIFRHLKSKFLLGSRIPSFYGHTVRFSSVCSCLSHYKNHISVPH